MKKHYPLILSIFSISLLQAQLVQNNDFAINPYVISSSNTGYNGNHEIFIGASNHFAGLPGSPINVSANYNGVVKKNMGLGVQFGFEKFGAFRNFRMSLSYAYHLKIAASHRISVGISASANQTSINFSDSNSDPLNDAQLNNDGVKSGASFNAGFGITYATKGLMLSVSMPYILENKKSKLTPYTQGQMLRYYIGYNFDINKSWSVKPQVLFDHYLITRFVYTGLVTVKYNNRVWLNLGYSNDLTLGGGLGVLVGERFTAQYTFKFSPSGIYRNTAGGHELVLGVLIGKNKKQFLSHSVFRNTSKSPYHDWE